MKGRRRHELMDLSRHATLGAGFKGRIRELPNQLEPVPTSFTLVFVERHGVVPTRPSIIGIIPSTPSHGRHPLRRRNADRQPGRPVVPGPADTERSGSDCGRDTRRTAKLLAHYEIRKPMVSLREHNEHREAPKL